jgi:hypothetical protein
VVFSGHVEEFEAAGGCRERDGSGGRVGEIEGWRDGYVVGQQRELGGSGAPDGKAEHAVPERYVTHAFPELVDHAGDVAPGRLS